MDESLEEQMRRKHAWLAPHLWDDDRSVFNVKDTKENHIDILPLLFTYAIVVTPKNSPLTYADRWCYYSFAPALQAAVDWDATGWSQYSRDAGGYYDSFRCEPQGWHRHPVSGRRRDAEGNEYVSP